MNDAEFRSLVQPPEFRAQGTKLYASGVAMAYGQHSKPIGGKFREEFRAGSFTKTLQEQDIHSHLEHTGPYLARSGAKSLVLTDSRSELAYEIELPDTTAGRDAAALLERGDIKGASIGFRAIPSAIKWAVDTDGMALRSISEARLGRVDLTVAPYYDTTTAEVALRSLAEQRGIELRSVLEAADRGELPILIEPPVEGDENEPEPEGANDGREITVVHRRPAHWFV